MMPAYGMQHLAAVLVIVAAVALALVLVRRDPGRASRAIGVSGWILLAVSILWTVWGLLPGNWDVRESLPVHYSDALRFVAAIALIRRSGWAIAVTYFWGLTLNLQSIITPALEYMGHPVPEYLAYWSLHGAVLAAAVVLVWGLGYRPTWRGYAVALGAAVLWAGYALTVNALTGANYAYLSAAPDSASVLDLLGGWPTYILWEAVLVASVWALMTLPWTLRDRRSPAARHGGLVRQADVREVSGAARSGRGSEAPRTR